MFGESLGGSRLSARDFEYSWMGVGALPTNLGINPPPTNLSAGTIGDGPYNFGSKHPGMAQFVRCDGSLIRLRDGATSNYGNITGGTTPPSTDWWFFQQLAGYKDGSTFAQSSIMEE
jgi:hypothetical protein